MSYDPLTIIHGDALSSLRTLESESVQCCVTSPPYWGLRDYGIEPLVWDETVECDHEWGDTVAVNATNHTDKRRWQHTRNGRDEEQPTEKRVAWLRTEVPQGQFCVACGAWAGCLGLEPTPELYVSHVVQVFRELKRVLRSDGVLFLNLGDSYYSNPGNGRGGGSTLRGGNPHLSGVQRVSGSDNGGKVIPDYPDRDLSSESLYGEHKDVSGNRNLHNALRRVGEQAFASCLKIQGCTEELRAHLPIADSSRPQPIGQSLIAIQDRLQSEVRDLEISVASLVSTSLESSSLHAAGLMLMDGLSAFRSLLESFVDDVRACAHRLGDVSEMPDCKAGTVLLCEELERRTRYTSEYCLQLVSRINYSKPVFGSGDLKPKDLVGIPWMVAFALRADGWYLRSDIIWAKPNPMPESVIDRPTKSHEYIFLLTKSERYYYDAAAIAEPVLQSSLVRAEAGVKFGGNNLCPDTRLQSGNEWKPKAEGRNSRLHVSRDPAHAHEYGGKTRGIDKQANARRMLKNTKAARDAGGEHDAPFGVTRNKRSVWTVATAPFSDAHFATFPPDLIKPCILAGAEAGATVIDPFAGSGTTAKVAIELGRKAIAIEPKSEYVEMIKRRCQTTIGLPL